MTTAAPALHAFAQPKPNTTLSFAALLLAALILVCLPFLGVNSLGLSDHANHMARFHISETIETSEPLQSLFVVTDDRTAYLGMNGVMRGLAPVFGVETAGYIFTILALYLPLAGALTLNRVATGRAQFVPLVAFLFVFSEIAGWGFTNHLFTMGLSLFALAAWLATDRMDWRLRLPLLMIVAAAIAALHSIVAVTLGFAVAVWELSRTLQDKGAARLLMHRAAFVVAAFLPAALLVIGQVLETSETGGATRWLSIGDQLEALLSPLHFMGPAGAMLLHALPLVFVYLALRYLSSRLSKPVITFDTPLLWVAAALYLLGPLMPFSVSGVAYIGIRFPVIAAFIAAAAIRETPAANSLAVRGIILSALLFKAGLVHLQLRALGSDIDEIRAASDVLPRGSKLLVTISADAPIHPLDITQPTYLRYSNFAGYQTIDRDVLFPYFFSMFDVQPRPEFAHMTSAQDYAVSLLQLDTPEAPAYAATWREDFDAVLHLHFGDKPRPDVPDTTVLHDGGWFSYSAVNTPAGPQP